MNRWYRVLDVVKARRDPTVIATKEMIKAKASAANAGLYRHHIQRRPANFNPANGGAHPGQR